MVDGKSRTPLVSHIIHEVENTVGESTELEAHNIEEIAAAVEYFLKQKKTGDYVDSRYLVVLTSKALSSVGHQEAARHLVIFGTGLVSPQEWEFAGNETLWALDLHKMTLRSSDRFEMIFFNSMVVVLESVADVWDKTSGRGVLALKHVCSVAASIMGGSNKKAVDGLASEIIRFCSGKLARIGEERGWLHTPRLINLDS